MFKLSLAFSAATLAAGAIPDIDTYCTTLETKCPGRFGLPLAECKKAFSATLLGDDTPGVDDNQNTLGCRMKFLNDIAFNATTDCRYSGPSGGGRCGPMLENTCQIAVATCNDVIGASYVAEDACITGLGPIAHQWGSLQGVAAGGDDSLECRLYHSYTVPNTTHCAHFGFVSPPCVGRVAPNVDHYCDLLESGCTGSNDQFGGNTAADRKARCMVVAAGYAQSEAADTGAKTTNAANTLGCREYHAQAANLNPTAAAVHCEHAGPSGGGVCGGVNSYALAWGSISAAAPCMDPSVNALIGAVNSTILQKLIPKGPAGAYTQSLDNLGNTQACRIYHLGVAAQLPLQHCVHGTIAGNVGGGCGVSTSDNLCKFIGGACGFGSAAWQFPNETQCITDLTGLPFTGPQPDTANNTVACRFYHAGVAASFGPGGIASATPNATDKMQFHCGHVLRVSLPGGCGYVAPPTTLAPSAAPSTNSVAPTSAAAPTAKPAANGVSVVSSLMSLVVVIVSVFFL